MSIQLKRKRYRLLSLFLTICMLFTVMVCSVPVQKVSAASIISNLSVKDTSNAANWSVQSNLQVGDQIFGDRTYEFTNIPTDYLNSEWIRTANDSKSYTGTTLVTFTVSSSADVYVAHRDVIETKPSWMSSWTDTGDNITANDVNGTTITYSLFKKNYTSGSTVSLGSNGDTNKGMYTIIVKPSDTVNPTSTPTPTPTGMISSMTVNDGSNAGDWSVKTNIQPGNQQYGDRTFSFTTIPSSIAGSEWIRTANDSKAYTGTTLVTFNVTKNADVYVAHNDATTSKPSWLSGWTDTSENIVNDESPAKTFSLYKKYFDANSSVSLGSNGSTTEGMYTVIVKENNGSTPTPTPTSTPTPTPPPPGAARYMTPTGAGAKDGTSWANAFEGNKSSGLQTAWDATSSNGTLYVGSGSYTVTQTLSITTSNDGSSSTNVKTIKGYDTGAGLPSFKGDWKLTSQTGTRFIDVATGASNWVVQDIKVGNYAQGVYVVGGSANFKILNMDVTETSDGIYLRGGGTTGGTHDFVIENCDFLKFTKRGIRMRDGCANGTIRNCVADGGGSAFWASGNFPMGFQVTDSGQSSSVQDHDITFYDCIGKNAYHEDGTSYWNGDGFCVERASYNIKFYRCRAFDNTDGGWDCKSNDVELYDCVAFRNKRNFRFWSASPGAYLKNCIAGYAQKRGGSGDALSLWASSGGIVKADYCTFYNSEGKEVASDGGPITLNNCIVAEDRDTGSLLGSNVTTNNCDLYIKGVQGTDPRFVNPVSSWNGVGTNFNSQTYGTGKGYYQAP